MRLVTMYRVGAPKSAPNPVPATTIAISDGASALKPSAKIVRPAAVSTVPAPSTARLPTRSSARPDNGITATKQNAPRVATAPAAAYDRCCAATSAAGMKNSAPSSAPMRISSVYVIAS